MLVNIFNQQLNVSLCFVRGTNIKDIIKNKWNIDTYISERDIIIGTNEQFLADYLIPLIQLFDDIYCDKQNSNTLSSSLFLNSAVSRHYPGTTYGIVVIRNILRVIEILNIDIRILRSNYDWLFNIDKYFLSNYNDYLLGGGKLKHIRGYVKCYNNYTNYKDLHGTYYKISNKSNLTIPFFIYRIYLNEELIKQSKLKEYVDIACDFKNDINIIIQNKYNHVKGNVEFYCVKAIKTINNYFSKDLDNIRNISLNNLYILITDDATKWCKLYVENNECSQLEIKYNIMYDIVDILGIRKILNRRVNWIHNLRRILKFCSEWPDYNKRIIKHLQYEIDNFISVSFFLIATIKNDINMKRMFCKLRLE